MNLVIKYFTTKDTLDLFAKSSIFHIVLDRGMQFDCKVFHNWCLSKNIKTRFGKIGESGSIARVERFHRSMKDECSRLIIVPTNQSEFEHELSLWATWYNSHRPHMALLSQTGCQYVAAYRTTSWLETLESMCQASVNDRWQGSHAANKFF